MIELSIVLISKNQAWNIARLIESVLQATSSIAMVEILLVDSASTDETVEVASRYPITILRLRPGHRLSPAAGRYIGYKRTRGEFVLFLDGDMELLQGWLGDALRIMRDSPRAGVMMSSRVIDMVPPAGCEPTSAAETVHIVAPREMSDVSFVAGGAALYRHSVLEEVGSFNPYLYSDEEPELYLRIRRAGYRVVLLDQPMVRHFSVASVPESVSVVLSRRRRNFLRGVGQCMRYHLSDKLLWPYISERGSWSLVPAFWLAAGLASFLASLLTGNLIWSGLWFGLTAFAIASAALKKRSLRRALVAAFHRLLMVEGLIRGFLMKPLSPESYPQNAELLQEADSKRAFVQLQREALRPSHI